MFKREVYSFGVVDGAPVPDSAPSSVLVDPVRVVRELVTDMLMYRIDRSPSISAVVSGSLPSHDMLISFLCSFSGIPFRIDYTLPASAVSGGLRIPVVFINSDSAPFLPDILAGKKIFETRSRDMLHSLVGQFVLLAETGRGARSPIVQGAAVILNGQEIRSRKVWNSLRPYTRVPRGNMYDWTPETKVKHIYELRHVQRVPSFLLPADAIRHGRTWAEYVMEV